jgi:hypothetical protein
METSSPEQYLGFGMAPQGGRNGGDCPPLSLALLAVLLTKLPLSQHRNNLIQQHAENFQQKILAA